MDYYYDYSYSMDDGVGMAFGIIYIIYYLAVIGLGVAGYILRSSGMYAIAKRRGIQNPWLSWIPVANVWILGSISDQFRYITKGQVKNKRKILLALNIVMALSGVVMAGVAIANVAKVAGVSITGTEEEAIAAALGMVAGMLGVALVMFLVAIVMAVFRYMALYDLYCSVNPSCSVVFLVLSILFTITEPFFIFFNRKKDLGMPPRCDVPQEPVVYSVPEYIPPQQPIQEPWENNPEV